MSTEVDKAAAELLALAIKHNRQEYIDALSFLVPVAELAGSLREKPEGFNDSWKKKLLRDEYTQTDIQALVHSDLLKNPEYLDFIVVMAANAKDSKSKFVFIERLMSAGQYPHALQCHQALDDKEDIKKWFVARLNRFRVASNFAFFNSAGEAVRFDRNAGILFDALDLDMPDNFDGVYGTGHKKNWSPSRFAASVDWVSDITESEGFGAPTVERQVNGELAIANGTLLTAFINERTRIASKPSGSWHDTHFPRHAPIIATPDMVEELQALGAILVEPNYGQITHDTYYNVDVITPSHAFQCASDSDLNAHDISLSMSFLPYDVITDLRNNPQSKKVLLVPHDTRIAQLPALPVPDTLRVAMRYHRPDFFKNRASNALYDFHVVGISTRAYLRGMDINYEHNNKLSITAEILTDPRLTRAFSSPLETQYLQEFFTPGNNDRPQYAWLDQTPNGGPFEQQIDNLLGNLDILIKHLDYMPRLKFYGSEDFVRAFVERNIPITNINDCSFWKEEGSYAPSGIQTDAQKRLSARLGDVGYKFPELPPEELLVKAVRTNDSTFHQRACGVLDRLGVVEVANLARTPAQRTFVIENFDVRSHVKELPVAIRKMISGPMLEDALGL